MKIILSSCDFGNPTSARFIADHLGKPMAECRVLYFPNEKVTKERIQSGMYEARVSAFGFQRNNVYVADYFNPAPCLNLDIDVIYISGGNTFGTMKRIRDSGLDKAIVRYVQNGVVYIGGSAGAHIATANIAHVIKYDTNTFGLTDFSGLGLYDGILICHYTKQRQQDLIELRASSKYSVQTLTDIDSLLVEQ